MRQRLEQSLSRPQSSLKGQRHLRGNCVRQTSGAPSGLTGSPSSPTARPTARPAGGDTEAQTGKGPSEVGAGPRFPEEAREPGGRVAEGGQQAESETATGKGPGKRSGGTQRE